MLAKCLFAVRGFRPTLIRRNVSGLADEVASRARFAQRGRERPALTSQREWTALSTVRDGRVFATDSKQSFNRFGLRMAEISSAAG